MSESWQLGSRYTLERQIGSGAMGQVWAGHDVDGHALAFKLLRPELADDPGVVARFLQERNLLVGLRSPHVIRVHDLVVEGPRLAIVMDYVAGDSLRALLQRRGDLPPLEVATLGAQIADGLAAVHGAGVLHRDLKPENVLLDDTSAATLVPKLADFGVASLVTQTGQVATANVIGTPQYLAPELGDGQPSGRAGDLYALGVTLYEMACGAVPFHAESPVALLRLHADHAPTRPAGIPDALWSLIAELLAKNPPERPDDAAAVARRLEAMTPAFAGLPAAPVLTAPPATTRIGAAAPEAAVAPPSAPGASDAPHPASRVSPPRAPHRRSAWLGAALVVALALVALVAWLLLRDTSASPRASASRTPSPSSTSTQPTRVPLPSALSGGARATTARVGSSSYADAVVPLLSDRDACTSSTRFVLDARYADAHFAIGPTTPQASVTTTATVRLDGRARESVTLGADARRTIRLDVTGVRTMTVDLHSTSCSPNDETSPVALVDGVLTTR